MILYTKFTKAFNLNNKYPFYEHGIRRPAEPFNAFKFQNWTTITLLCYHKPASHCFEDQRLIFCLKNFKHGVLLSSPSLDDSGPGTTTALLQNTQTGMSDPDMKFAFLGHIIHTVLERDQTTSSYLLNNPIRLGSLIKYCIERLLLNSMKSWKTSPTFCSRDIKGCSSKNENFLSCSWFKRLPGYKINTKRYLS